MHQDARGAHGERAVERRGAAAVEAIGLKVARPAATGVAGRRPGTTESEEGARMNAEQKKHQARR